MNDDPLAALPANPVEGLLAWLEEAREAGEPQPDAMALATANRAGTPSVRMVLFKGIESGALRFYTNHFSLKARDLRDNPQAAVVFYWQQLHRQVRVSGAVERMTQAEAADYFQRRPRESQLSAMASQQSFPVASRGVLEERVRQITARYGEDPLPLPDHWGGYRLRPHSVEFWVHRHNRLHDRLAYTTNGATWQRTRLSP